ncbi:hypothetical protein ABB26_08255 [Stenotrophomonas humi]|uniref:Uncharacterized protein n=1 Tax=Stenotrophomonas humi TaxID=405444 RepID=A0A0R0CFL0_9GAMM|nr:hypothetical protein ABB26_08255 [Stenotrophomonas humi]
MSIGHDPGHRKTQAFVKGLGVLAGAQCDVFDVRVLQGLLQAGVGQLPAQSLAMVAAQHHSPTEAGDARGIDGKAAAGKDAPVFFDDLVSALHGLVIEKPLEINALAARKIPRHIAVEYRQAASGISRLISA